MAKTKEEKQQIEKALHTVVEDIREELENRNIMNAPQHLYVKGRKVEDIDVKRGYAKVLLKGAKAEVPVPFRAIVWRSDDWNDKD